MKNTNPNYIPIILHPLKIIKVKGLKQNTIAMFAYISDYYYYLLRIFSCYSFYDSLSLDMQELLAKPLINIPSYTIVARKCIRFIILLLYYFANPFLLAGKLQLI